MPRAFDILSLAGIPPTLLRRASPWGAISAPPGEAEKLEKGESNALPTCARNPSPLRAYIRPQNPTPRNPPQSLGCTHALTKKLAKSNGCNKFPTSSPDLISDLGVLRSQVFAQLTKPIADAE
jgi:hypothetical protein